MTPAPEPFAWRRRFPTSACWDAPIEATTLPALLAAGVALAPDRPAIAFRGRSLTYRALADGVDRLAAGMLALGVEPGQAVALYLPNTPFHPLAFFALTRIGARVVHLSALDAPREIAHKLADSGARLLVTTNLPGLLPKALALLDQGAADTLLVGDDAHWGPGDDAPLPVAWSGRVRPLLGFLDTPPPSAWPQVSPDDIALLQYTGGTTGLPKGAMLSHGNLTAAVAMYRSWTDGAVLEPGRQKVIAVLPFFHIYALTTILLRHLRDGNEILLRQRFDAAAVLHDIETGRATVFPGVPTMWIALLNHPGAAERDYASLRACVSGGAPMPLEVHRQVETLIGRRLASGWGMTEIAPAGTRVPHDTPMRPGLIGAPLPGIDMRVVALDDPSRVLGIGEVGELALRGPNVFRGYWNQPEATAEAFRDGFFLTGDIGRVDADGLFEIVDRKKNMIISSGFNVYPVAIENAIYEHPDVEEVIVIGVADAYRGQAAKAFVKLKAGAAALTLDALRAFLHDRLGRHEMPAALEIRPTLPRSPASKLLARALIEEERAKAAADAPPKGPAP